VSGSVDCQGFRADYEDECYALKEKAAEYTHVVFEDMVAQSMLQGPIDFFDPDKYQHITRMPRSNKYDD
jgi:hypothetical protein